MVVVGPQFRFDHPDKVMGTKKPTQVKRFLDEMSAIIVTGASSGIGESLIKTVINLGYSGAICNLSRTKPAYFLKKNHRHFACDLSQPEALAAAADSVCTYLSSEVKTGPILLINNSGFGAYGAFQDLDRARQTQLIDLNIRAVVDLTHRLLPSLLERGGVIANVASIAGFQPCPILATYGASKSFVLDWTLALGEDLRGTGVTTLAVCPGPTSTAFFRNAGFGDARLDVPGQTADAVVWETLYALARGKRLIVTGWRNRWLVRISRCVPLTLLTRISGIILRRLRNSVSPTS
jgi:short-subunit dehydrogenase